MAPSFQLLGPPILHEQTQKPNSSSSSSGDHFVDLMLANFNNTKLPVPPPRGYTENFSPTFLSTGNPCLDFFFHIVADTPPETLHHLLVLAWEHNSLMTLKLICNLRGVRGTGKSDKEGFYTAALWLHKNHPKTLACNMKWFAGFGYFKDLPEILYRLLEGPNVRKIAKEEFQSRQRSTLKKVWRTNTRGRRYYMYNGEHKTKRRDNKNSTRRVVQTRENRVAAEMKKVQIQIQTARILRKKKEASRARKAVERYSRDSDFRFLHDQIVGVVPREGSSRKEQWRGSVSDGVYQGISAVHEIPTQISQVFADQLVSDKKFLNCGETGKISLASKWCPSLDSSFDKATLLCESIARRVFPRDSYPEYEGIEEAHYAYRVRDRLRKEILVPLRQTLELPEVYMSSNRWDSLPYNRVASVAMRKYKKHFLNHDKMRFKEFLDKVGRGEAKIAAGALFPHEIISSLNDGERDGGQVAELQWKRMVDDLCVKGKLKSCIPVCDVSGSMSGTPMEVCVALGLLLSELSEDPWKGKVITFSDNPQLHMIEGDDLRSKTQFVRSMDWGYNTNFQRVFDLILQVAITGSLSKDKMIKKVFVFSDMEFDAATGGNPHDSYNYSSRGRIPRNSNSMRQKDNNWDTDYEVIQRKFKENGYTVPEIVFWNLRDSKATPVKGDQKGVALVSGFSKNMMSLFLDEQEIIATGPEAVMELALDGPEYKQLVVLD